MRKLLILLCALFVLFLSACGEQQQEADDSNVGIYQDAAQEAIDSGDTARAVAILEEGISLTDSQVLKDMLDAVTLSESRQPQSTPAPTDPPVPPTPIAIDDKTQYTINAFLSAFAAADLMLYPCDDYTLLTFALRHANLTGLLEWEGFGYDIELPASTVDAITEKFFSKRVTPEGPTQIFTGTYSDPSDYILLVDKTYQYTTLSSDPYSSRFAIASKMEDCHNGTYAVAFDVYETWEDAEDYYGYATQDTVQTSDAWYLYSGTATVVGYVAEDGTSSYQLTAYSVNASPFTGTWTGDLGEQMTVVNYDPNCFHITIQYAPTENERHSWTMNAYSRQDREGLWTDTCKHIKETLTDGQWVAETVYEAGEEWFDIRSNVIYWSSSHEQYYGDVCIFESAS